MWHLENNQDEWASVGFETEAEAQADLDSLKSNRAFIYLGLHVVAEDQGEHVNKARIVAMSNVELLAILHDPNRYDEATIDEIDAEIERREGDGSDPSSDYDHEGKLKADRR